MEKLSEVIRVIDDFVWGPAMLVLLVGTGIFLTVRLRFLPWRNLGYALRNTLSKEARTRGEGTGDISPFSALTTALAATIGTGNIVGVATAMAAGGPGALVWMWISALFGLSSKFAECMLAIKYRECNEKGEMSGGPMYTMKKAFRHKKAGVCMGWMFALFAVIASFGIGNMTQANSISDALHSTFSVPVVICGIVLTIFVLFIIVGGIGVIASVSSVVVPIMAIFYAVSGIVVILGNITQLPAGVSMIFKMAFSMDAVGGGMCGTITSAMMHSMRYGVARGVFSNEAGMGSAAITAAAASTNSPVKQGYVNMTGTFWDTIVVCTITGLCIAGSGVLGTTKQAEVGTYTVENNLLFVETMDEDNVHTEHSYTYQLNGTTLILTDRSKNTQTELKAVHANGNIVTSGKKTGIKGMWTDAAGEHYQFRADGSYEYSELVKGSALTILAFETVLGKIGGGLVCIGIVLFAFSTILGWEYHGEKAFEYLLGTHRYNMIYRILYSAVVYVGATTALDVVWNFSDIANALMAVPNLICLLALSGVAAKDTRAFQREIHSQR